MKESLSYTDLNKRMKELSHDTSLEAQAEFDDLLEQLVTMDMGLQSTRRAMSRSQSEQNPAKGLEAE